MTTLHDCISVLGRPLDTLPYGLSQLHGHGFWIVCEVAFISRQYDQCSRLKSSMPFKRDLAFQNKPLPKQPFKMQPQMEKEDVT